MMTNFNTFVNVAQIKMTRTLAVVFGATQKAGEKLELRHPSVFYGVACVQFVNGCTISRVCFNDIVKNLDQLCESVFTNLVVQSLSRFLCHSCKAGPVVTTIPLWCVYLN